MRIKLKRIGAYLIDYAFVILLASLIGQLEFLNPYYNEYQESYEKYVSLTENLTVENAVGFVQDEDFMVTYQEFYRYGTAVNIISIIVYLLYFVGFQKWNKGQTLGKKMFNLRVVDKNKDTVSWLRLFIRTVIAYNLLFNVVLIILCNCTSALVFTRLALVINGISSIIMYAILISVLVRKDNKGFHDLIMGTEVVGE